MPSEMDKYKEDIYRAAYPQNSAYWVQGRIDQRFKVGDQEFGNEVFGSTRYRSKYQFFFNFIRRQVNMLCGYYRQHRKSTIAVARRDDAQQDSDDMTTLLIHCYNLANVYEIEPLAFEGAVTAGQDFLHVYKHTLYDQTSGDLAIDHVGFQNVLIDPWYRKQDLSDCNYIWRRKWLSDDIAQELLPDKVDEGIFAKKGSRDGKFPMQAQALGGMIEMLNYVDELFYRTTRKAIIVTDLMSGKTREWPGEKKEIKAIAEGQPWLVVKEISIPTVNTCISVNGVEIYDGPNQLGIDRFPFVPYLCYHEPDVSQYSWKTQGIVRGLRSAQYLYNRRKIIEFDMLESQPNSGWIYKPNHLVDPKSVYKTGQGQGIALKESADETSLQRIQAPEIPPSVVQLSESLANDMLQISGINEELLGAADDDKAGILSQLRQSAGLTTLMSIIDKADFSKKILGEIYSEAIVKNFTTSKITAILGRAPSPTFFDVDMLKFGIEIQEGIYSETQRQLALRTAAYFRETLQIPIPDQFFIEKASLPDKNELIMMMKQEQQQQAEQQQAMQQMEMQKEQVDAQSKMSKAAENVASAELKQVEARQKAAEAQVSISQVDRENAETLKILAEFSQMVQNPNMEVLNVG